MPQKCIKAALNQGSLEIWTKHFIQSYFMKLILLESPNKFVTISTKFDEKKIRLKSWLLHQTCKMAKNCCHKVFQTVNLPENDDNKKKFAP